MADEERKPEPRKIKIPKQTIRYEAHIVGACQVPGCKGNHKRDFDITKWDATNEDGSEIFANCQAFGNRVEQLKEAIGKGPIEVYDMVRNEKFGGRWDVKFEQGSGREAGYRGRYGDKKWVPGGYRGKPISFDRFFDLQAKAFERSMKIVIDNLPAAAKKELENGSTLLTPVLETAQDLAAQYFISVEKNVSFPEGCEPAATSTTTESAPASSGAAAGEAAATTTTASSGGRTKEDFEREIAIAPNAEALDAIKAEIAKASKEAIPDGMRSDLFLACFNAGKKFTQ